MTSHAFELPEPTIRGAYTPYATVVYTSELSAPRIKVRVVTLNFPRDYAERIADDSGKCQPHVEVDGTPLLHVKFPAGLRPELDAFISAAVDRQHKLAVQAQVLPLAEVVRKMYRNSDPWLRTVQEVRDAHVHLQRLLKVAPHSQELVNLSAELAQETVLIDTHEAVVEDLKNKVAEAERDRDNAQYDASESAEELDELVTRSKAADRLNHGVQQTITNIKEQNFEGFYGTTDMDKVVDMLELATRWMND